MDEPVATAVYLPVAQPEQPCDPVVAAYVPMAQLEQAAAPSPEYLPTGQVPQFAPLTW